MKFGRRATLGADSVSADMFAEAQAAWLRSRDAGQPLDVLPYLANGQRLAAQAFELTVGQMRDGAVADLLAPGFQPLWVPGRGFDSPP